MNAQDLPRPSVFRRWIAFNLVGLTGVMIQLAVLTLLQVHGFHYLAATTLAVEAAVLNNFGWHERWTWLDRTQGDRSGIIARLIRFNLTIGLISIAQNLFFMKILVGHFGIHFLAANLISITVCSLLNFWVSDRLVFRERNAPSCLAGEPGHITS